MQEQGLLGRFAPSQLVVIGFGLLIIVGSLLLWLPVSARGAGHASFVNALFTSASAVCVTGLIVVNTASYWSAFGQVVIAILIQLGGLGIMATSAVLFMFLGRRLGFRERLLLSKAMGDIALSDIARIIVFIVVSSLVIEGLGALMLALHWMNTFPVTTAIAWGAFHSVSAFNNAGFDLTGDSLVPFQTDWFVNLVVMALIVIGGIGFTVIYDLGSLFDTSKPSKLRLHTRLVLYTTAGLIAVSTILILTWEYNNPATLGGLDLPHKILGALFAAVTPRTAGFSTIATSHFLPVTLFFTIILMFIGASPASTGGGVKTTTLAVIIAFLRGTIAGQREPEILQRRLAWDDIRNAFSLFFVALGFVFAMTLVLIWTGNGQDFLATLFETTSAFGTVGLSMGLTSHLNVPGKLVITLVMFTGRVGPMTFLLAMAGRRRVKPIRQPEEHVMIG